MNKKHIECKKYSEWIYWQGFFIGLTIAFAFNIFMATESIIRILNLIFTKNEAKLRNTLFLMAKATLSIIVETQNGKFLLMGKINAVNMTAGTVATGKAYGDLNGTSVTLTGKEPESAQELSSDAIDLLNIV